MRGRGAGACLVPVQTPATRGAVALCLEVHDLLVSKYVANREKDRMFARAAIKHGLASEETLLLHLQSTPVSAERARMIADAIRSDFKSA